MAHKKGQGSSRNGRDSNSKRLGTKVTDGQLIHAGTILVRQRGARWVERFNVGRGRDFTLFALVNGKVKFESGNRISVYPSSAHPAPGGVGATEGKPAEGPAKAGK